MEKYGKVFKILRESKKMSLKEVAGDFVTPAQLSRFENGKSNLSVDIFFNCLKRLNVTEGEFSSLYFSYYQSGDITDTKEFYRAVELHQIDFLKKHLQEYQKSYDITGNRTDRLMVAMFHMFIRRCDPNYIVPKKEKEFIIDYLLSIDDWGRYELWIFGNGARFLTTKSLEILGMEVVSRTQFYNNVVENRKRVYRVLLNVTGHLLDRGEERIAVKFIRFLDDIGILEKDLFERLQLKFFKAHLQFLQGNPKGLEVMKECQKMADFLDCYDLSKQIEDTISHLTDM